MSPPATLGMSHPTRSTSQQISQHKRSLSFNHHLSYNQHQQLQQQQQPNLKQVQMQHPVLPQRKEMSPLLNQSTKIQPTRSEYFFFDICIKSLMEFSHEFSDNWSITSLRHAHPLRPCFLTGGNSLTYALGSKKVQPTFEEDALVLRVIESYCAAFQNTSRHTMHSGEFLYLFVECHLGIVCKEIDFERNFQMISLHSFFFICFPSLKFSTLRL
jgi:Rho guanine nucleotide exchange factor 7